LLRRRFVASRKSSAKPSAPRPKPEDEEGLQPAAHPPEAGSAFDPPLLAEVPPDPEPLPDPELLPELTVPAPELLPVLEPLPPPLLDAALLIPPLLLELELLLPNPPLSGSPVPPELLLWVPASRGGGVPPSPDFCELQWCVARLHVAPCMLHLQVVSARDCDAPSHQPGSPVLVATQLCVMVIVGAQPGPGVAHQLHMSVPHTVPFSSQSVSMMQSSACARAGVLHEIDAAAQKTKDRTACLRLRRSVVKTMRTRLLRFKAATPIVHETPCENPCRRPWRGCCFVIVAMADREGPKSDHAAAQPQTSRLRARMIDVHLIGRGIADRKVLDAFRSVPRERFVPEDLAEFAYDDTPLPRLRAVREELASPLLERAIGVVYRRKTELESHYFYASLPRQFDEYVWFDETRAVHPLEEWQRPVRGEVPDTYPFGL